MTKRKIVFTIFEWLFIAIVPFAVVIYQYGFVEQTGVSFKISVIGIIMLLAVYFAVKNVLLKRKLTEWEAQYNNYVSEYKIATDAARKDKCAEQIRRYKTLTTIIRSVFPALLFVLIYVLAEAVEAEMIKLTGVVGVVFASYCLGVLFSVLSAREVG